MKPETLAKVQEIIKVVQADAEFVKDVDSVYGWLPLGGVGRVDPQPELHRVLRGLGRRQLQPVQELR